MIGPSSLLTESVDALRRGDFERRVPAGAVDELGRLADGFNRMAESLAVFRRTNLGVVCLPRGCRRSAMRPTAATELRERVFEKFFRVEHQRALAGPAIPEVGIGLYLCRQIIEAHGGSIHCDAGGGTQITVLLSPYPAAPEERLREVAEGDG